MTGEGTADGRIVNPPVGDGPPPWRPGPWLTAANVLFGSVLVVGASSDLRAFWLDGACAGACVPPADWIEAGGLVVWLVVGLNSVGRVKT